MSIYEDDDTELADDDVLGLGEIDDGDDDDEFMSLADDDDSDPDD